MKKTKQKNNPKKGVSAIIVILIVAVIIALILILISLFSSWTCSNGQWIRNGFPLSGKPQGGCEVGKPTQAGPSKNQASDEISAEMEQAAQDADKPAVSGLDVTNIKKGDLIKSPLAIKGTARGIWYFEGEFPVKLMDGKGNFFAQGNATAKGDWMTEGWVPFEASITFQKPATGDGFLYFMRNDPSGLPQNSYSVAIPINFSK